jgi:hypothetical protein
MNTDEIFANEQEKAEAVELLRKAGSADINTAHAAQAELLAALQSPLRSGVLTGNIITGIFETEILGPGARAEYPIDLYRPDNEGDFTAYVIPKHGRIPQRHVEGDYVTIPTYSVGAGIDMDLSYVRDARWNVVARAMEVFEAGFVKKMNDDGWHTILKAAVDRNILVSDSNAVAGQFTKRLISLLKLVMRRNAGGNSTSLNRGKLTHVYLSPEAVEDMRNWGIDEIDEITRREIYTATDGSFSRVFGVNLIDLDELGENQEYQKFFDDALAASMAGGDVEIAVGLDLSKRDSFIMPVKEQLTVHNDPYLHRENRMGVYGRAEHGFGVLDNRRIVLASM